jgi:hypothetical protein
MPDFNKTGGWKARQRLQTEDQNISGTDALLPPGMKGHSGACRGPPLFAEAMGVEGGGGAVCATKQNDAVHDEEGTMPFVWDAAITNGTKKKIPKPR